MKARQMIGGSSFPPGVLSVLFAAFDAAWDEVAPQISARASAIEAARLSLAEIVLAIAKDGIADPVTIKTAAVDAFRAKHRLGKP